MITTKQELLEEFDAAVESYDDDILFYFNEYKNIMPVDDMAMYLVRAFKNRVWMFAEEIIEREEEND